MPNSNRQRGDYLERQTRAALEAHGWICVRAAGSLGIADIVALRAGNTPLLVSCKITGQQARAERIKLVEGAQIAGARPLLATRVNRGYVDFYSVLIEPGLRHIDTVKVPNRPGKGPPDDA